MREFHILDPEVARMGDTVKYLKAMNDAPVVIGTNHAISLGWQLRLVCDDARILKSSAAPRNSPTPTVVSFRTAGVCTLPGPTSAKR